MLAVCCVLHAYSAAVFMGMLAGVEGWGKGRPGDPQEAWPVVELGVSIQAVVWDTVLWVS